MPGDPSKNSCVRELQRPDQDVDFAKKNIFNAKVLKEIKIVGPKSNSFEWVAGQGLLLQMEDRASRDVEFDFIREC